MEGVTTPENPPAPRPQSAVIAHAASLPGAVAETASASTGAPEIAWGDTFVYFDPDGTSDRRMPFATIVIKDYPGFDTASRLDRPGVYRVNVGVGRELFEELVGYPPAAFAEHAADIDFAAFDVVVPHPIYAAQGWISVVCPGPATAEALHAALAHAHSRAARRRRT